MPKQSVISGALVSVTAQAVVLLLGFITHPLIGRLLGTDAYGVYSVVLSIQTIIGMLLTLGIPLAVSRFVARDEEHAQSILWQALRLQVLLALGIAVLTVAGSHPLARLLGDRTLTPYLAMVAVIVLSQAIYPIFTQYLSGLHRFNRQAALTTVYAIAKLAGAVGLLFIFYIYGALLGFAVGGIVATILGFVWAKGAGGRQRLQLPTRSFLSFAGTFVLILIGLQILINLDLLMVKALLKNNTEAGHYSAASNLARISYLLLQGLVFILLPKMSALTRHGESHEQAIHFIRQTVRYLIALIIPGIAIAATTSKSLILLFYGREYVPATSALTILMIGLGSLAFYLLLITIAAGAGRARVGLLLTVGLLAFSAGLGFILIPRFGLIGAAWQTTLTGLIGLTLMTAYITKTFRISLPTRSTINIIIASAVAVLPTYVWSASSLTLPLQYILLATIYVAVLWLLKEITPADRQYLKQLRPRHD